MADTTYNSLGVDEVAAQHVNAQCVVSTLNNLLAWGCRTFSTARQKERCLGIGLWG